MPTTLLIRITNDGHKTVLPDFGKCGDGPRSGNQVAQCRNQEEAPNDAQADGCQPWQGGQYEEEGERHGKPGDEIYGGGAKRFALWQLLRLLINVDTQGICQVVGGSSNEDAAEKRTSRRRCGTAANNQPPCLL